MSKAVLAVLLVSAAFALAVFGHGRHWQLPDRYNPWKPLSITEAPGLLTRYKLSRLDDEPSLCLAVLGDSPMAFEAVPDRSTGPGCGFRNAVRVSRTQFVVGQPFSLSCPAAVSLALWEQHVVQPEAERLLGARVVRLEHYGSYACRNIDGREGARRSRHATADALDVAGFALADGRRITVARHWQGEDVRAEFLHAVHRSACRFFDGVLGPAYNAAHADHLHLDRGRFRVCR